MNDPRRAPVRPRVLSPATGEALPLDDLVLDAIRADDLALVQIVGTPGSGKTTALRHLAAVFAEAGIDADFVDDAESPDQLVAAARNCCLIISTKTALPATENWLSLTLAAWADDDVLEYLLAQHKSQCAAILAHLRFEDAETASLHGIPELWTLTLDFLANHPDPLPLRTVLHRAIMEQIQGEDAVRAASQFALSRTLRDEDGAAKAVQALLKSAPNAEAVSRLLRHAPVQEAFAISRVAVDLKSGRPCAYFKLRLPKPVVVAVAFEIRDDARALAQLRHFLTHQEIERHPMAASIYHQTDRAWLKSFPLAKIPSLNGAYLDHADWPGVNLENATLSDADLSFANLANASLDDAVAYRVNFHHAVLAGAMLREIKVDRADFSRADLRGMKAPRASFRNSNFQRANLDDATFYHAELLNLDFKDAILTRALFQEAALENLIVANADFTAANFNHAKVESIDFREAKLDRTVWQSAYLKMCNFEEIQAAEVDFRLARLHGTLWTGSTLTGANFSNADLRDTGLAEIHWEGANLRAADLRGASFHLGSSRSGLVSSPIAREGSMTGFYTDDFSEQDFKSPEEIRKANLRGADLREANVEGTDFYLVDLRDALYDEQQAKHFRACGAILHDRGEEV